MVLTTPSVSFFESCGVRSATLSMSPLFVIGLPKYSGAGLAHPLQSGIAPLFLGLLGELPLERIAESRRLGLRLLRREILERSALLAIRKRLDRQRDLLVDGSHLGHQRGHRLADLHGGRWLAARPRGAPRAVHQPLDAVLEPNEGAEIGDVGDLAGDLAAQRVPLPDAIPGIGLELLDAQGELLVLPIDPQNHR